MKKNTIDILKRRILAFLIDIPIIIIIAMLIFFIYSVKLYKPSEGLGVFQLAFCIISFSVIILKDAAGVSLGKRVLKIKVIPSRPKMNFLVFRRIVRNITFIIWPLEVLAIILSGTRISDRVLGLDVIME